MRRSRRSRVSGREAAIDDLFGTPGLEGDLLARGIDPRLSLRPFAEALPSDPILAASPPTAESEAERLLRRARELTRDGKRREAVQRYQRLLELESGHVAARTELALLLEGDDAVDEALSILGTGLRRAPGDPSLLVTRGAILGRLKRHQEAEQDLRQVLRHHPEHPEAHFTLGLVLWRKGLPTEAAAQFRKTLTLVPDHIQALYYVAEAQSQAGDLPGALATLSRATALAGADARVFQLAGRILDRLARPEEAREMYARARSSRPS